MREYKSLAEWLASKGNPKHSIADGENGYKVLALESPSGLTLFTFSEKELPDGSTYFYLSSGWGVSKEYFPAIKKFLNTPKAFYETPEMSITIFDKSVEIDCIEDDGWIRKAEKIELDDCSDIEDCEDVFYAKASVTVSQELFNDILKDVSGPEFHFIKLLKEKNITHFYITEPKSEYILLCNTEGFEYLRYVQLVDVECLLVVEE